MSGAGRSRSSISSHLVVMIAVSLSGMYVMDDSDSLRRGWDRRARSM